MGKGERGRLDDGQRRNDHSTCKIFPRHFVKGYSTLTIPQHFEFYKFISDRTVGYNGILFDYSDEPTASTPKPRASTPAEDTPYDPLTRSSKKDKKIQIPDEELEGFKDDPKNTKVVDRRWYERNKHIYPMTIWEEWDPKKDYSNGIRKDAQGNAFFFS
jgi:protein FAM50